MGGSALDIVNLLHTSSDVRWADCHREFVTVIAPDVRRDLITRVTTAAASAGTTRSGSTASCRPTSRVSPAARAA